MAAVMDYLDSLEMGVCLRINQLSRKERVRRFFSVVSRMGDGGFWISTGLLAIGLQGPGAFGPVAHTAATGGIGVLIYKVLKAILVRHRPFIANGEILCGTAPLDQYSFPSGHTLHAVSFTIMFGSIEPALLPAMLPFVLLVAASRVILGLHYPSDVLVGAAIGVALAMTSLSLM